MDKVLVWCYKRLGLDPPPTHISEVIDPCQTTMQMISLIEVGSTDKFPMIVVKQIVIVFGSTRTFNAVDFHAWNWQNKTLMFSCSVNCSEKICTILLVNNPLQLMLQHPLLVLKTNRHIVLSTLTNYISFSIQPVQFRSFSIAVLKTKMNIL